jgi:hypothetical protein
MEARLARRDSTQACRSDGGDGIDMKLPWENRRKYAHEPQSDAFHEARFLSFAADKAGLNDGKRFESGKGGKPASWLSTLPTLSFPMACFGNAFHKITITAKAMLTAQPAPIPDALCSSKNAFHFHPLLGSRDGPAFALRSVSRA